jgi:hypothetical protein
MTKKHFIQIADAIREHNRTCFPEGGHFNESHLLTLADQFRRINPNFNRERWLDYIAGRCGSNGGKVKPSKPVETCDCCDWPLPDCTCS